MPPPNGGLMQLATTGVGRRSGHDALAGRPRSRSSYLQYAVPTLVGTTVLAGSIEVLVARTGAPLAGFWAPEGVPAVRILVAVGSGAAAAAALLVVVTMGAILATRRSWGFTPIALSLTASTIVLAAVMSPSPGLLTAGHLTVAAAAIALALAATATSPARRATALVAALAVACGQLAFLATGGVAIGLHRLAEIAVVALPIAAAWSLRAEVGRLGRTVAVATGVVVWVALAVRGGELAMLSTWAFGATLSLPPFAVAACGAGWALLASGVVRQPAVRLIAAGVVLVWIAGIQPTAIHHNLTSLLGVMAVTGSLGSSTRDAAPGVQA